MCFASKIFVKLRFILYKLICKLDFFRCRYVFCDNIVVVKPASTTSVIRFDNTRYFSIPVSEEFIDYCSDSALSIEVWGLRSVHPNDALAPSTGEANNNSSITDRWKEVTSQLKLWAEIQV